MVRDGSSISDFGPSSPRTEFGVGRRPHRHPGAGRGPADLSRGHRGRRFRAENAEDAEVQCFWALRLSSFRTGNEIEPAAAKSTSLCVLCVLCAKTFAPFAPLREPLFPFVLRRPGNRRLNGCHEGPRITPNEKGRPKRAALSLSNCKNIRCRRWLRRPGPCRPRRRAGRRSGPERHRRLRSRP